MGFVHAIANIAGALAPAIVGLIIGRTGSWTATFGLSAAVCVVGALLMARFGRTARQPADASR
jgi:sugar phosphate permease